MGMERPTWYQKLTDSPGTPRNAGLVHGEQRLTPETVHNHRFTTTRLMQGYAVEEVDAFLDRVMDELARLIRERDEALAAAGRSPAAGDGRA